MSVLDQLATSLKRRDEVPNQELGQKIAGTNKHKAVKELIENLAHKDKNIQSDCIKALYEIGDRQPGLIAGYYKEFGRLLDSKDKRLVWGVMIALDAIAATEPKGVHSLLAKVLAAADDSGSVIARDHAVGILTKLGALKQYASECLPLLLEQLMKCPNNQFPMYVEMSLAVTNSQNRQQFQQAINHRLNELEKESQRKRVLKALKKLAQ
jgi:hypothetical protein